MSGFLLDASVVLASIDASDQNSDAARELLVGDALDLASLDLVRYEIANVVAVSWQKPDLASAVLAIAETLGGPNGLIRSEMSLLMAACEIAEKHSISVYDAAYVVAARTSGRTLVSCDERDLISNGLAVLPSDALAGL